jgi:hypothetical protein
MPLRYCRSCAGDVEDVGGYCLLGHPIKLSAPVPSGAEMRAEVTRALGEVSLVLDGEPATEAEDAPEEAAPPPPPEIKPRVWELLTGEAPPASDPITAFAPPAHMDWGPECSRLAVRSPLKLKWKRRPAPA